VVDLVDVDKASKGPTMMRHLAWATVGAVRYEIKRCLTPARLAIWMALSLFPPLLLLWVRWFTPSQARMKPEELHDLLVVMQYLLIPQVVVVLGLLLWAAPAVQSELESRSWIYPLIRPRGAWALLLGKYLAAVAWAASSGLLAALLCWMVWMPVSPIALLLSLLVLTPLASLAYGALFLAIGTLFPRRAMVIACVYYLLVEGALSMVPAAINQLTVGYRLRVLLTRWVPFEVSDLDQGLARLFPGSGPQLPWLFLYVAIMLGIALHRVRRGEYPLQDDS
jgi:ABC-type transport system involved in multi-copper enzyme maturation permease subunit